MEHLTFSYNPLGTSGVMALVDAIKEDTLANLVDLQLKNCSLKKSEACASLLQVLPDHCIHLKQIDMSDNLVDSPILLVFEIDISRITLANLVNLNISSIHNCFVTVTFFCNSTAPI